MSRHSVLIQGRRPRDSSALANSPHQKPPHRAALRSAGSRPTPVHSLHGSGGFLAGKPSDGPHGSSYHTDHTDGASDHPNAPRIFSSRSVLRLQRPARGLASKLAQPSLSALLLPGEPFPQPCNGWFFPVSQVSDQMPPP